MLMSSPENRTSPSPPRSRPRADKEFVLIILLLLLTPLSSFAAGPMTYIYNAPESKLDVRYLYHREILKTALDKTKIKYGPYRMAPSEPMTEKRQTFELMNATGRLTVMYLINNPFLGPGTPFEDKKLWFDPETYR
jgi:hypothetical protein